MFRTIPSVILVIASFITCQQSEQTHQDVLSADSVKSVNYAKFNGSYKSFCDLHDLHLSAAIKKGITPMSTRADTLKYIDKMVHLPNELDVYKIDKLTYSIPYLVPDAATLLVRIGVNFRDSLIRKKIPLYKIIVTSVTRTDEDVINLTKRNSNASDTSAHSYGTTFDISWKRFQKKGSDSTPIISTDRLKFVLGQVLYDLRRRDMCYIVHERKQACFHITVR